MTMKFYFLLLELTSIKHSYTKEKLAIIDLSQDIKLHVRQLIKCD